jgi:CDP-diacylglycerol--serine O-phosphatidyltransferase
MAIMAILAGLMISSVPYGNLKQLRRGNLNKLKAVFLFGIVVSCFVLLREKAFLALIGIYIASGPLRFDWGEWLSLRRGAGESGKN